jgi:hypothetical protein
VIYFIQGASGGPIKIGTTIRLSQRIKQLEKKEGIALQILGVMDGSYADEAALHERFIRMAGEWFHPTPELLDLITTEARAWDGTDEVPLSSLGVPVKIDTEVVTEAKMVAASRNIPVTEYLNKLIRSLVRKDLEQETSRRIHPKTIKSKGESM